MSLGIRWTIGDVSPLGFFALRLAIHGAYRIFGARASYAVTVNTVPVREAQERAGALPCAVLWHCSTPAEIPTLLRDRLGGGMAEGVGWKFAPLRLFPDAFELSFDNDCILWEAPPAVRRFSEGLERFVIAEDVRRCVGKFDALCGPGARNSGIRALPPRFDLAAAFAAVLEEVPGTLGSELDEQGLQVAALERAGPVAVVGIDDVSICSPFPPHVARLGRCGAHFVGLNAKRFAWTYAGRPAEELVSENFLRNAREIARRVAAIEPLLISA